MLYCQRLKAKDFTVKAECLSRKRIDEREYLNDAETKGLMRSLSQYFENMVEIPRIRVGKRQTIETLVNEECFLFAKYLRDETKDWDPRIPQCESL